MLFDVHGRERQHYLISQRQCDTPVTHRLIGINVRILWTRDDAMQVSLGHTVAHNYPDYLIMKKVKHTIRVLTFTKLSVGLEHVVCTARAVVASRIVMAVLIATSIVDGTFINICKNESVATCWKECHCMHLPTAAKWAQKPGAVSE